MISQLLGQDLFLLNSCYTTLYLLDLFVFGPKFGLFHYEKNHQVMHNLVCLYMCVSLEGCA